MTLENEIAEEFDAWVSNIPAWDQQDPTIRNIARAFFAAGYTRGTTISLKKVSTILDAAGRKEKVTA